MGPGVGEGSPKVQTPIKEKKRVTMDSWWKYRRQADCLESFKKVRLQQKTDRDKDGVW